MEFLPEHIPKEVIRLQIMTALSHREAEVIRGRYGIGYKRKRFLEEIGKDFGVSRERIRQIQREAEEKLRAEFSMLVRSIGMDRETSGDDVLDLMGAA